jgi:murein tripeptide amidase MpaA
MRSWLALPLTLLFALISIRPGPPPDGETFWVVRAYYSDPQMMREMAGWIEPWEVHAEQGYVAVGVDQAEYTRLEALGFRLEVDAELTEKANRPPIFSPLQTDGIPGYGCYRTVEETYATAGALAAAYPTLATWSDIGDSWEKAALGGGYDLKVLRLTNAELSGTKPRLFAMAAAHAREYATAELLTRFAESLLWSYGSDPDTTWLLDYHEIHLLLVANPDGRKKAEAGQLWRKNTNRNYCAPTSPDRGADLNRNYDFAWGCCGGSSVSECFNTYRGPAPASEPEVQAIQAYLQAIFPDQRGPGLTDPAPLDASGVFLDVHSYGQLVLWPWGFTGDPAPNQRGLQTLGRKYAFYTGYTAQQSYELYPTDGDSDGFAYGELGLAGYTIELGNWFFQDCATFEATIAPANLPALKYMAKSAAAPYLLPAGPEALSLIAQPVSWESGAPVRLRVVVNDRRFPAGSGEPMQEIAAAEYSIDAPPWAAGTPTFPMQPVDGAFDERVEEVQAIIDISGLSPGRHTVYVRGRDVRDYWGVVSAQFIYTQPPLALPVILR